MPYFKHLLDQKKERKKKQSHFFFFCKNMAWAIFESYVITMYQYPKDNMVVDFPLLIDVSHYLLKIFLVHFLHL